MYYRIEDSIGFYIISVTGHTTALARLLSSSCKFEAYIMHNTAQTELVTECSLLYKHFKMCFTIM